VTSPETARLLGPSTKVEVTGYPVRSSFVVDRPIRDAGDKDPQVLVMGGSQGSAAINRALVAILPDLLVRARVVHVCGRAHFTDLDAVRRDLPPELQLRYRLEPELDSESMAAEMLASDLAVTRAGASILGELPATGLPAVVVPLPINAQDANAAWLEQAGGCVVLEQQAAEEGQLGPVLISLLEDSERRTAMRQALESLRRPHAASDIAAMILATGSRAA